MLEHNSKEYLEILRNVHLNKIGFLEIHSVIHLENYVTGEMDIDIKNEIQIPETDSEEKHAFLDKYKITGNIKDKSIFDIETTIVLVIESKEKIGTDFLKIFSEKNCKIITYPYLRQAVQDLTSKMGLPVLSLPLWQNPATIKEEGKKEAVPV